jgi:hypothetical protein
VRGLAPGARNASHRRRAEVPAGEAGLSNDETAEQLTLSAATVDTYLSRSMSKAWRDAFAAGVLAYEIRLVKPGQGRRHPTVVVGLASSKPNAVDAGPRGGDDSPGVGCHGVRYAEIFLLDDHSLAAPGAAHRGDRRGASWLFGDAGTLS